MLLDCNFKSYDYAGRRITLITPCKRSAARGKGNQPHPQPHSGLNYYVVPEGRESSFYPELRFACTGLSTYKTYGLNILLT